MKIGIVTCWQPDDNYGTQIQCFALQMYLRFLGHDAFLIRYMRFEDVNAQPFTYKKILKALNPYYLIRFIYNRFILSPLQKNETQCHNRNSPEFRKKYLNMTSVYDSYQELKQNPPRADAYIVGSDQVWNIHYRQTNNLGAHFLDFGNKNIKRIAYAASFGFSPDLLEKNYSKAVWPLLRRFSAISVRESAGLEICRKIANENNGKLDAVQVCDPTMLLSCRQYLDIFSEEEGALPSEPYVLVYNISAKSELRISKIKKWAKENGLALMYVTGHGRRSSEPHIYPSVPQWVKLIANAEYVITNSFHGTVFSLIFHKHCAVFPLTGKVGTTNNRLDTLLKLTGTNLVVNHDCDFDKILNTEIDWTQFEKNKESLRQIGVNFLNKNGIAKSRNS